MRFASVAEIKDGLSEYLARARKKNEPIVVTHHGKPYALIQPLYQADLEALEWKRLARRKLTHAWEDEEDAARRGPRAGRARAARGLGPLKR